MQAIEKMLEGWFKSLPPLPEEARKSLATAMPWLALAGGVLSLVAAWNIYRAATAVDALNSFVGTYGVPATTDLSLWLWAGVAILVAQAVIAFVAFPALRTHKKSGWDLMLGMLLATVVYGVFTNLTGYFGVNIGGLLFSLAASAVGVYLLFQVRSYFGGAPAATAKTVEPAAPKAEVPAPKTDKKE